MATIQRISEGYQLGHEKSDLESILKIGILLGEISKKDSQIRNWLEQDSQRDFTIHQTHEESISDLREEINSLENPTNFATNVGYAYGYMCGRSKMFVPYLVTKTIAKLKYGI